MARRVELVLQRAEMRVGNEPLGSAVLTPRISLNEFKDHRFLQKASAMIAHLRIQQIV